MTPLDISDTIIADSTQINAADLAGPVTITVTRVTRGNEDQPINIFVAEFPDKAFRPCKTVRRILVQAWGKDASAYVGRRMCIFNDTSVRWGGQQVGGVRVSALSHISKPLTAIVTESRGKFTKATVQPLPDAPAARDWRAEADALTDADTLRSLYREAPTEARDYIAARARALTQDGPNVTRAVAQQPAAEPEGWEKA